MHFLLLCVTRTIALAIHVIVVLSKAILTICNGLLRNPCRILSISLLKQLHSALSFFAHKHAQISYMHAQLLHCSTTKRVARCDKNAEIVLQEPEADFAEVGGFSDAIDSNERNSVRNARSGRCWAKFSADGEEEVG